MEYADKAQENNITDDNYVMVSPSEDAVFCGNCVKGDMKILKSPIRMKQCEIHLKCEGGIYISMILLFIFSSCLLHILL
jgi:hypothetical protein